MGLNYFADSKSDTGGGIRSVRTLDLSAKWRPRASVSIYVLRHIAGLCGKSEMPRAGIPVSAPQGPTVYGCALKSVKGSRIVSSSLPLLSAFIHFPFHLTD